MWFQASQCNAVNASLLLILLKKKQQLSNSIGSFTPGGWWGGGGCHFCLLVKKGDDAKKICMMWADMKKNAPFKISSALPHFSKHNKCSLINQTNSFTTQREDKCWSRIEELILITNSNVPFFFYSAEYPIDNNAEVSVPKPNDTGSV